MVSESCVGCRVLECIDMIALPATVQVVAESEGRPPPPDADMHLIPQRDIDRCPVAPRTLKRIMHHRRSCTLELPAGRVAGREAGGVSMILGASSAPTSAVRAAPSKHQMGVHIVPCCRAEARLPAGTALPLPAPQAGDAVGADVQCGGGGVFQDLRGGAAVRAGANPHRPGRRVPLQGRLCPPPVARA